MPDVNKLDALAAAGFKILPCCATCKHFDKAGPRNWAWGVCTITPYGHAKHSGGVRMATVHIAGSCPRHELRDGAHIGFYDAGFLRFEGTK